MLKSLTPTHQSLANFNAKPTTPVAAAICQMLAFNNGETSQAQSSKSISQFAHFDCVRYLFSGRCSREALEKLLSNGLTEEKLQGLLEKHIKIVEPDVLSQGGWLIWNPKYLSIFTGLCVLDEQDWKIIIKLYFLNHIGSKTEFNEVEQTILPAFLGNFKQFHHHGQIRVPFNAFKQLISSRGLTDMQRISCVIAMYSISPDQNWLEMFPIMDSKARYNYILQLRRQDPETRSPSPFFDPCNLGFKYIDLLHQSILPPAPSFPTLLINPVFMLAIVEWLFREYDSKVGGRLKFEVGENHWHALLNVVASTNERRDTPTEKTVNSHSWQEEYAYEAYRLNGTLTILAQFFNKTLKSCGSSVDATKKLVDSLILLVSQFDQIYLSNTPSSNSGHPFSRQAKGKDFEMAKNDCKYIFFQIIVDILLNGHFDAVEQLLQPEILTILAGYEFDNGITGVHLACSIFYIRESLAGSENMTVLAFLEKSIIQNMIKLKPGILKSLFFLGSQNLTVLDGILKTYSAVFPVVIKSAEQGKEDCWDKMMLMTQNLIPDGQIKWSSENYRPELVRVVHLLDIHNRSIQSNLALLVNVEYLNLIEHDTSANDEKHALLKRCIGYLSISPSDSNSSPYVFTIDTLDMLLGHIESKLTKDAEKFSDSSQINAGNVDVTSDLSSIFELLGGMLSVWDRLKCNDPCFQVDGARTAAFITAIKPILNKHQLLTELPEMLAELHKNAGLACLSNSDRLMILRHWMQVSDYEGTQPDDISGVMPELPADVTGAETKHLATMRVYHLLKMTKSKSKLDSGELNLCFPAEISPPSSKRAGKQKVGENSQMVENSLKLDFIVALTSAYDKEHEISSPDEYKPLVFDREMLKKIYYCTHNTREGLKLGIALLKCNVTGVGDIDFCRNVEIKKGFTNTSVIMSMEGYLRDKAKSTDIGEQRKAQQIVDFFIGHSTVDELKLDLLEAVLKDNTSRVSSLAGATTTGMLVWQQLIAPISPTNKQAEGSGVARGVPVSPKQEKLSDGPKGIVTGTPVGGAAGSSDGPVLDKGSPGPSVTAVVVGEPVSAVGQEVPLGLLSAEVAAMRLQAVARGRIARTQSAGLKAETVQLEVERAGETGASQGSGQRGLLEGSRPASPAGSIESQVSMGTPVEDDASVGTSIKALGQELSDAEEQVREAEKQAREAEERAAQAEKVQARNMVEGAVARAVQAAKDRLATDAIQAATERALGAQQLAARAEERAKAAEVKASGGKVEEEAPQTNTQEMRIAATFLAATQAIWQEKSRVAEKDIAAKLEENVEAAKRSKIESRRALDFYNNDFVLSERGLGGFTFDNAYLSNYEKAVQELIKAEQELQKATTKVPQGACSDLSFESPATSNTI